MDLPILNIKDVQKELSTPKREISIAEIIFATLREKIPVYHTHTVENQLDNVSICVKTNFNFKGLEQEVKDRIIGLIKDNCYQYKIHERTILEYHELQSSLIEKNIKQSVQSGVHAPLREPYLVGYDDVPDETCITYYLLEDLLNQPSARSMEIYLDYSDALFFLANNAFPLSDSSKLNLITNESTTLLSGEVSLHSSLIYPNRFLSFTMAHYQHNFYGVLLQQFAKEKLIFCPESFCITELPSMEVHRENVFVFKEDIEAMKVYFGKQDAAVKPVKETERGTYLKIIRALLMESGIDKEKPYAAAETIQAIAASKGVTIPSSKETIANKIKELKELD